MYAKKQYEKLLSEAWEKILQNDLKTQAGPCGMAAAGQGEATFESLGRTLRIVPSDKQILEPDGRPARRIFQIVVLHHILHSGGAPLSGKDMPLHSFPDLMLYSNTIRWRVLDVLAKAYGTRPELLLETAAQLGGTPRDIGDAAVRLMPLPLVPCTVVIHAEDEEFPADAQVLFDEAATSLMPPEDMVVLSELMAHRLANMAGGEQDT